MLLALQLAPPLAKAPNNKHWGHHDREKVIPISQLTFSSNFQTIVFNRITHQTTLEVDNMMNVPVIYRLTTPSAFERSFFNHKNVKT